MTVILEEIRNNYYKVKYDTNKVRALKIIHSALEDDICPENIVFKCEITYIG